MGCSLPGCSVHGIFRARVLEWGAISFSRGSSRPRDRTRVSCIASRYSNCLSHQESFNTQLKASRGGTLSAPFWCLCQKLSLFLLYFNKTWSHTHTHTQESEIFVRNCRFLFDKALERGMGVMKVEPSKPRYSLITTTAYYLPSLYQKIYKHYLKTLQQSYEKDYSYSTSFVHFNLISPNYKWWWYLRTVIYLALAVYSSNDIQGNQTHTLEFSCL